MLWVTRLQKAPKAGVLKLLPNWGYGSGTTGFQNFRNASQLPLPLSSFCFHGEPHDVMGGPTPNAEVSPPNWGCGITHAFKVSGTLDNFSFHCPIFIPMANSIFGLVEFPFACLFFFSKGRSTIHVSNHRCHQLDTSRSLCDFFICWSPLCTSHSWHSRWSVTTAYPPQPQVSTSDDAYPTCPSVTHILFLNTLTPK